MECQLTSCKVNAQAEKQRHTRRPQRMRYAAIRRSNIRCKQGLVCMSTPRWRVREHQEFKGVQVIPYLSTVSRKVVKHQKLMGGFSKAKANILNIRLMDHTSFLKSRQSTLPHDAGQYRSTGPTELDNQLRHQGLCTPL